MNDTNTDITRFDNLIAADGPAALVVRDHLIPAEGADAVFFPATYADIGYNIDWENHKDRSGRNVCLIDSVGSQANRMEPMFKEEPYSDLVPQIVIKAGEKEINLLDAGHRAGDAIVRCSALKDELYAAFQAILKNNNALPLAKIAPTSLVFGVWDSRDTQAKLPRLIASTVRAYDVRKLTRSATYISPFDYSSADVFTEEEKQKAEGDDKNPLSKRGFVNALNTAKNPNDPKCHGGVIADGGIRRDAVLALSALRLLNADTPDNTFKLQRYILGLALVAFTKLPLAYYRQGTILTLDPDNKRNIEEVRNDGTRSDAAVKHETALAYAKVAARDFVIGKSKTVSFDVEKAKVDLNETKEKKAKNKKA
ncbi:MAG: type I-U CRISPR-associated protein Cas7 [Lentisphaerae bacterium]|nr:type I-U CRISPR-associated protein Cas7 [Lentisphaerota bacterium]